MKSPYADCLSAYVFPGMNACVETGRIEEAMALLLHMKEARIRPGHGAYNIIIKHWCRIGEQGGGGG